MSTKNQSVGRLHSRHPADAAWRAKQAQVDADIEGLAHDDEARHLVAEMKAEGIPVEARIERLKAYVVRRRERAPIIA